MGRRLAVLAALGAAFLAAAAAATSAPAPSVTARAALVGNGATGEVLYRARAAEELPMASVTKLMTALVVLDHLRPDDVVTVGGPAPAIPGSRVGLRAGERLTVRDLMAAMLIQSANDAAYALAYAVGHGNVDRFVAMMNAKARELGLRETHFARPDGLDAPDHHSSARDLFKLGRLAMHRPMVRTLVRIRTTTIPGGRTLHTWNDLLSRYPGTIGVKTGHTGAAGWNEVAAARRHGLTMYAVILGSPSREQRNADLVRLLDWAFAEYRTVVVVQGGRTYATAAIPFSDRRLALVAPATRTATLREGRRLVEHVVATKMVSPPIAKGQRLGELRVLSRGKLVARSPLVAAEEVPAPGFGTRLGWYAGRALDHAGNLFGGFFGLFS